ncbi:MAG: aldo/keto reductase [Candidatus Aminicenantes bacterium]|nr:aldo/keto reductase [Candidatus Aminicenantes bacterium]
MNRKPQDRRTFIRTMAGSAVALGSSLAGLAGSGRTAPARLEKNDMVYRRLGRTGLQVSEISLGGSPLPDPNLLRALIDRGINYIDTSHNYDNGNSERMIGRLLKDVGRDKVRVSTKFHVTDRDTVVSIVASVHGSLRRLATETIDVLCIHGAESADVLVDERVLSAYEQLKREGAYRFRGLSCHVNHDEVVRKAVECGLYDMVQVGYNVFDIQETSGEVETYPDYLGASGLRGLLALAHSRDVGIIAMKTLKVGGRRQDLEKYKTGATSIFQAMLKWVLEDSRVASAVTEILNERHMEEDLGAAGARLTGAEERTLARFVRERGQDYCHGCARCRRACPSGVATTAILHALAYEESYGKSGRAREAYAALGPKETASACRDCGTCEKACPYGVAVRSRIREAARLLT